MQALGLQEALDSTMPLEAGGLLYYDSVHSVWLYEAEAVQARLHTLKDVRFSKPPPTPLPPPTATLPP